MPAPIADTDPRTEVGRVGVALNRMLGHVGDAPARRQASEQRLRHFAADAGHELRTPVASVRGHAELALRHPGPMPPQVRHSLERIQAESQRMSAHLRPLHPRRSRTLARHRVDRTGPGHRQGGRRRTRRNRRVDRSAGVYRVPGTTAPLTGATVPTALFVGPLGPMTVVRAL